MANRLHLAILSVYLVSSTLVCSLKLTDICQSPKTSYTFTGVQEVRQLLKQLDLGSHETGSGDNSCNDQFLAGLRSLRELLDDQEALSDVCGSRMFRLIRRFHLNYISVYHPAATQAELTSGSNRRELANRLPEVLRNFFVMFGQQVSAQCKRHLVERLTGDDDHDQLRSRLPEEAFEAVLRVSHGSGCVRSVGKFDRRVFDSVASRMSEVSIEGKGEEEAGEMDQQKVDSKLYFRIAFNDKLRLIARQCELHFRPIYSELFRPVMRLAELGYDDLLSSQHENEQLEESKQFVRWYGVIQVCETLRNMEFIEDNSTGSAMSDLIRQMSPVSRQLRNANKGSSNGGYPNRKLVLLSKQEADLERANIADRVARLGLLRSAADRVEAVQVSHQPVEFTQLMWVRDDEGMKRGLRQFAEKIRKLETDRTSKWRTWTRGSYAAIRAEALKHGLSFVSRDEESALGRLAWFLERHKTSIRLVAALAGLAIVMAINFG